MNRDERRRHKLQKRVKRLKMDAERADMTVEQYAKSGRPTKEQLDAWQELKGQDDARTD